MGIIIGIFLFFFPHIGIIYVADGVAKMSPSAGSRAAGSMGGETEGYAGRLTPNSQDEVIIPIKQWRPNTFVDLRVPRPAGLVAVKRDVLCGSPRLTYVSSLDNWRAYKEQKSDRPFTGDLLVFDIFACQLNDIEEAREQIQIIIWDEADFFGNIPDTYMGFRHSKSSDNENIILYGFTKIDTDYVFVSIFFTSQCLGDEDYELYKKMMEDYFLKLRKVNSSPLVTYEREPPEKPAEKCVIPGGASVSDEGETIFIFRDCIPGSIIKKRVPVPAGFTIVQDDPKYPSRFEFVSDIKTWEEFNERKDGEHFNGNLVIFNVSKGLFDNDQEAYNEIEHLFMGMFGKLDTFGDLPNTHMAYNSYPLSTCSAILMGNTKILDEYVQVFMHVWHGCLSDNYSDIYKKMMIDYFQKIRNINYRSY